MQVYIFDLDGTLCDCSHRLHHIQKQPKDWDAFFAETSDDPPIQVLCDLVDLLYNGGAEIVFLSGRPERCREDTLEWLDRHFMWPQKPLYLRPDGDFRNDDIVKAELLDRVKADGFEPILAFEDRPRVARMFRAAGVRCAQVVDGGDFQEEQEAAA